MKLFRSPSQSDITQESPLVSCLLYHLFGLERHVGQSCEVSSSASSILALCLVSLQCQYCLPLEYVAAVTKFLKCRSLKGSEPCRWKMVRFELTVAFAFQLIQRYRQWWLPVVAMYIFPRTYKIGHVSTIINILDSHSHRGMVFLP